MVGAAAEATMAADIKATVATECRTTAVVVAAEQTTLVVVARKNKTRIEKLNHINLKSIVGRMDVIAATTDSNANT